MTNNTSSRVNLGSDITLPLKVTRFGMSAETYNKMSLVASLFACVLGPSLITGLLGKLDKRVFGTRGTPDYKMD